MPPNPDKPRPPATGPLTSAGAVPGVVRYVDVEGGCWVIETADGRFQPMNLQAEFRRDGRAVLVALRPVPEGMVSVCQLGPMVLIDSIQAR